MKTTIKLLAVLALVVATFSQYTTASSASAADVFKFKGQSAVAIFTSDQSECEYTDVYVLGSEEIFQNPPGPKSASSGAFLYISQHNACTDTLLLAGQGFASVDGPDFQVTRTLDSATLNATVTVYDQVSGTSFDVFIDVTWTGTSSLSRQNSHSHFNSPGCNINSRSKNSFRSAEASGSVSDGTTNFTPTPSFYAIISYVQTGDVVVGCDL